MASVVLKKISKSFDGRQVLKQLDLNIQDGEFISLLGPSGCGKTTSLRTIAGLIEADGGEIFFDGRSVKDQGMDERGAVVVFQDYRLFPHLTVGENIGFGLKVARKDQGFIRREVARMLELVRMKDLEASYPKDLSGGQQQRVALARALAINPRLLLLDEPFSNLDLELREDMRKLTLEIQKELGITTILVTHDQEEAFLMSDRLALMLDGEIKQFDRPERIYQEPKTREIANFLGRKNYLLGRVKAGVFISGDLSLDLDLEDGDRVFCMLRPEDLSLGEEGDLPALIRDKSYGGSRTYYDLEVEGQEGFLVQLDDNLAYGPGDQVYIGFDREKLVFFKE